MQPNANTGVERGIVVTAGVTAPSHRYWCCFSIAIHGLFQPRELRSWLCRPWLLTVTACVSASLVLAVSSVFQNLQFWTMWQLHVSASASSNCVAAPCFGICDFGLCSSSVFRHMRPRTVFQHQFSNNDLGQFCVSTQALNTILQLWTLMHF